jgi:hypothetical protein
MPEYVVLDSVKVNGAHRRPGYSFTASEKDVKAQLDAGLVAPKEDVIEEVEKPAEKQIPQIGQTVQEEAPKVRLTTKQKKAMEAKEARKKQESPDSSDTFVNRGGETCTVSEDADGLTKIDCEKASDKAAEQHKESVQA